MLAPEFTLRDDFPPARYDEWRALAEADLGGAPLEHFNSFQSDTELVGTLRSEKYSHTFRLITGSLSTSRT